MRSYDKKNIGICFVETKTSCVLCINSLVKNNFFNVTTYRCFQNNVTLTSRYCKSNVTIWASRSNNYTSPAHKTSPFLNYILCKPIIYKLCIIVVQLIQTKHSLVREFAAIK